MAKGQSSVATGVWKKDSVKVRTTFTHPFTRAHSNSTSWRGPLLVVLTFSLASQDVAESIGIANLPDEVASALAGDVEYRLWEIIEVRPSLWKQQHCPFSRSRSYAPQESIKFMRHSRRTRLKVEDVDQALKVRNLEPLWGFASSSHLPFKKTVTPTGTVYHVDDEEIDLSKVLKTELPSVPRDVNFTGRSTAHAHSRSALLT